jgi:single-stranded DNA-binding protein
MFNKVILIGSVGDRGITVRPQQEGTMQASFLLKLTETNEAGRTFTSYQSVECYGRALAAAEGLHPGDVVLLDGKLRRRKVGEAWDTTIVALSLQRVQAAALAEEG